MKRILIILLLISAVIVIYFIPITQDQNVLIKTNFDNALSSLNKPDNWKKWNSSIKNLHSKNEDQLSFASDSSFHHFKFANKKDSIIIETRNDLFYDVREYKNDNFSSYALEIIPSLNATNSITIRVIEKTPLLFYIFPFLNPDQGEKAAMDLKNYLEDVKAFYGYDMKIEKVVDTVFATEMITISKNDLFKTLPAEFEKIRSFIKRYSLTQTNFASVSYIPKRDSIELILGIPVNKFVKTNSKIDCVNIPKGRMLTAIYEGKFGNRQDIYQAFKKYTKDKLLENVGAPFESYVNDRLPSSDSSIVKFKLYYPVL
jgi:effector-binding domain-containing protein